MLSVKNGINGFVAGFFSLWKAFCFIRNNSSLYKYVAIPLIINVVVFSGTAYWGFDLFNQLVGQYFAPNDAWYWQIVASVIKLLAALVTLVIVFFTFTVLGNFIAAPFNDVLSERTEQLISGQLLDERFSLRQIGKDLWRVMQDEVRKMSLFILLMILLLVVNMLPGIGSLIYAVCSVLLTVFFLIVEYTGYVFSRKHQGFKEQRRFIAANRMTTLGFGLAVMCTLLIPFVQFLTIPLAVVAATHLCCCDPT
ncbi:MAG: sulfate transporter CysZ [Thermodesulfobacteriota bacterium]|nr:sulfate transporter CysZ [Thermodesulfobacteriota bacterium]